jgi:hypothetical protein
MRGKSYARNNQTAREKQGKTRGRGGGGRRVVCPLVQVDGALDGGGQINVLFHSAAPGDTGREGKREHRKERGRGNSLNNEVWWKAA